jgi:hypothetical protein
VCYLIIVVAVIVKSDPDWVIFGHEHANDILIIHGSIGPEHHPSIFSTTTIIIIKAAAATLKKKIASVLWPIATKTLIAQCYQALRRR